MANLTGETKVKVDGLIDEAMSKFSRDNISISINLLSTAWDMLPENKNQWNQSFLIAKYITHVYFNAAELEKAKEWGLIFNETDPDRDFGESEFMLGKIDFELGNFPEAKDWFSIADKKSGGRTWKGESDPKYFKFYKEKK